MIVYEREISITKEFLDVYQHVNNVQYVKWVEMIATEHWDAIKHKSRYKNNIWFLVDHHIQYKKQVLLGETLTIKTYPEETEGLRQPRKVEFYRAGELVVDSRTLWIMLHPKTQKIIRIDKDWLKEIENGVN